MLATGHYVVNRRLPDGGRALYRARESERDQSYFLFATTREQLDVLRFPLGGLPKSETRELAHKFGLAVADKQDSQDICFVPTGRYADIIERLRPGASAPGEIVDLDGKVLGRHDGIIHFTVGQRKGLKIAAREPLYVVRLDAAREPRGGRPARGARVRAIRLQRCELDRRRRARRCAARREVFVKVRSTRPPRAAWLSRGRDGVEVELTDGEEGVAPGQACVFYDAAEGGARVLGGGFIRARAGAGRKRCAPRSASRRTSDSCLRRGAMADNSTGRRSRRPMRAGRRSTIWCSARCSSAGARPRSRRPSASAGAFSKSASAPASRCRIMRAPTRIVGIDISAPMLRKAQERVAEQGLTNVEALAVMDAKHLAFPDDAFDVVVAQYVITAVPDPEGDARRIRARAQARRRDHAGQSHRRGERAAQGVRAGVRAGRAPARLAPGISVGAADGAGWTARRASTSSSAGRCRRSGTFR